MQNAGDIRNQIGRALNIIELNIEQQDVPGITWHVRYLRAKIGPYMTDNQKEGYNNLEPGEDESWTTFFGQSMEQVEFLLTIAKKHNLYGWSVAPLGDDDPMQYALGAEEGGGVGE